MHKKPKGPRCGAALGLLVLGLLPGPSGAVDLEQQLQVCAACHATGAGGAPKIGRAGDWAPRLDKGMPALLKSVHDGVPGTLMMGGICRDCSDEEIEALIRRMSKPE
ncbi:MAG: c-type cytochrome [Pseudomonadota bacterium]